MVKFDFVKVLSLSSLNQQFFGFSEASGALEKVLKVILLLLFAPVYLALSAFVYVMYFAETLLTIPSKLVHGIRISNTPYDEHNTIPFNVSYILLYLWIVPFDAFAILFTWFIALASLLLDLIGNIVCLGKRHLAAFELCFSNEKEGSTTTHRHFWSTVLGLVLLVALFVVGGKLATTIATSYETINTGIELIKVEKLDADLYKALNYVFMAIAYLLPTSLLTVFYNRKQK